MLKSLRILYGLRSTDLRSAIRDQLPTYLSRLPRLQTRFFSRRLHPAKSIRHLIMIVRTTWLTGLHFRARPRSSTNRACRKLHISQTPTCLHKNTKVDVPNVPLAVDVRTTGFAAVLYPMHLLHAFRKQRGMY